MMPDNSKPDQMTIAARLGDAVGLILQFIATTAFLAWVLMTTLGALHWQVEEVPPLGFLTLWSGELVFVTCARIIKFAFSDGDDG